MRHTRIERWNTGDSYLHQRHPSVKILLTLLFLVSLGTVSRGAPILFAADLTLLVLCIRSARLPLGGMLRSSAAVLPFALVFAAVAVLSGDESRAVLLICRAWLSALAVLLLVATSQISDLLSGLEWLRAPRFLLSVMQFLYRYLMVLAGEAAMMRDAGMSRAGSLRALPLRQAASAAATLFARAWVRAQDIHRAMLSRGFNGTLPHFRTARLSAADGLFAIAGAVILVTLRLAA